MVDLPASLCRSHRCAGNPSSLSGLSSAGVCFPRILRWQEEIRERSGHADRGAAAAALLRADRYADATRPVKRRQDVAVGGSALAAAVAGKMGGAIAGARWKGQSWRDAGAPGALLNIRGLVELIVRTSPTTPRSAPACSRMPAAMRWCTTLTTPIPRLVDRGRSRTGRRASWMRRRSTLLPRAQFGSKPVTHRAIFRPGEAYLAYRPRSPA